jgi:hypothetical protein
MSLLDLLIKVLKTSPVNRTETDTQVFKRAKEQLKRLPSLWRTCNVCNSSDVDTIETPTEPRTSDIVNCNGVLYQLVHVSYVVPESNQTHDFEAFFERVHCTLLEPNLPVKHVTYRSKDGNLV